MLHHWIFEYISSESTVSGVIGLNLYILFDVWWGPWLRLIDGDVWWDHERNRRGSRAAAAAAASARELQWRGKRSRRHEAQVSRLCQPSAPDGAERLGALGSWVTLVVNDGGVAQLRGHAGRHTWSRWRGRWRLTGISGTEWRSWWTSTGRNLIEKYAQKGGKNNVPAILCLRSRMQC